MRWQGRRESSNVEDRRGQGGGPGGFGGGFGGGGLGGGGLGPIRLPTGRAGGGLGIVGIVVVLGLIWVLTGENPLDVLTGASTGTTTSSSGGWTMPTSNADQNDLAHFAKVVLADTEDFWTQQFSASGKTYTPPTLVLFDGTTSSACGVAQESMGPFYCPNDRKVYLDLAFYSELRDRFGAPGDFAEAYVIAHEVGHHVQNLTGVLPEFNNKRGSMSQAQQNAYSVRVELQADCYAGVWANWEGKQNYLEQGDTQEAINAANQIGDDTLSQGTASPREYTHGTSAQRMKWLKQGMDTGDVSQCDTFSGTP